MKPENEYSWSLINGFGIGIESVDGKYIDEDVLWGLIVDLIFFRLTIIRWKHAL